MWRLCLCAMLVLAPTPSRSRAFGEGAGHAVDDAVRRLARRKKTDVRVPSKEALRTIIGVRSVRYSWALTDSRVMPVWTVGVTATEEDFMCPTQTTWRRARW